MGLGRPGRRSHRPGGTDRRLIAVEGDQCFTGKARGCEPLRTTQVGQVDNEQRGGDLGAGDMIICLGAGDITRWAAGLAPAIAARRSVAA